MTNTFPGVVESISDIWGLFLVEVTIQILKIMRDTKNYLFY